jgi:hypothetical protein
MRRPFVLLLALAACDSEPSSTIHDLAVSLDLADAASPDLSANQEDLSMPFDQSVPDLTGPVVDMTPVIAEPLQSYTAAAYNFTDSSFNTNYRSKKQQFIYLASDLSTAGIPAGATILALSFMPSQVPGRQLDGFRIGLANTTVVPNAGAVFPIPFYVNPATIVYGPVDEPTSRFVVDSFTSFPLATPFVWDGTSNLLVELTFELAASASGLGGIYMRATGRTNELIQFYAGAGTYPFTGINAMNGVDQVPRIQIQFY